MISGIRWVLHELWLHVPYVWDALQDAIEKRRGGG